MSAHRETLVAFVKQHGWTKGVELGVDKGILFGMLLGQVPDLHLTGVDLFPDRQRSRRAFDNARVHHDRARLIIQRTDEAHAWIDDGSMDFVFIDADHSYDAVASDIRLWQPKVRPGGWLGGHDYSPKFPGVIRAVDEAFGDRVEHMDGAIWGVWPC